MKKTALTFVLLSLATAFAYSQTTTTTQTTTTNGNTGEEQQTLNTAKPIKTMAGTGTLGAWIGFSGGYTNLYDRDAYSVGMRGGLIFGHSLTIGLAGKGFGSFNTFDKIENGRDLYLEGGYGGLFFEPVLMPSEIFHLSFPCLIGAGGAAYTQHKAYDKEIEWDWEDGEYEANEHHDYKVIDSDAYVVFEPGVELEMNLAKCVRLGFDASYRWVYGLNLKNSKSDILDGFTTGITLKLGVF